MQSNTDLSRNNVGRIKGKKIMTSERQKVKELFKALCKQPMLQFPQDHKKLQATLEPGVYVIRKGVIVLHVGRTLCGKGGLRQRLKDHLYRASSFTNEYLKGNGAALRKGHTHQSLVVKDARLRALLEAYAIGTLCPKHIGLGGNRGEKMVSP
jgi:hypothetical protein